jgi:hypothetical protein
VANWFVTANQEDMMKTLAILAALSLTACAVEEDYTGELGPRPAGKPSLDPSTPPGIDGAPLPDSNNHNTTSISETFQGATPETPATWEPKPGFDQGTLEWAVTDGKLVEVHSFDPLLGIDEITTYNEEGEVIVVTIRNHAREEIETSGLK